MTPLMILSTVAITCALIFYSIGVWAERLQKRLRLWHLLCFWCGVTLDTLGTGGMMAMSGRIGLNVHALTGVVAIALMLVHALWASVVLWRRNEKMIADFHKFSVVVWVIWLVPYLNGFFAGMRS